MDGQQGKAAQGEQRHRQIYSPGQQHSPSLLALADKAHSKISSRRRDAGKPLSKALLKWRRSDGTNVQLLKDICEEMADVQIMLDQMKMIYGSIDRFENFKIERLAGRLGLDDRV